MPNLAKKQTVEELNSMFAKAKSVVMANYQGIGANDLCALRRHMRANSVEFMVIKNTLAQLAAKNTAFEVLEDLKGPVSLVVSYDDEVAPAKALADCKKAGLDKGPEVIGAVVDGKKLTPEQVKALADLPSREVLLSQLLSTMQGPTTNFVGVFSALLRKLVGTLDAIRVEKEKSGS